MEELNLNPYDIARKSNDKISHGTVWNILNEQVREVKDKTLIVLAKVLEVDAERLFEMARGQAVTPDESIKKRFDRISLKFSRLKGESKKTAETLVDLLDRELERLGKL